MRIAKIIETTRISGIMPRNSGADSLFVGIQSIILPAEGDAQEGHAGHTWGGARCATSEPARERGFDGIVVL
jgi:hypothetical protein